MKLQLNNVGVTSVLIGIGTSIIGGYLLKRSRSTELTYDKDGEPMKTVDGSSYLITHDQDLITAIIALTTLSSGFGLIAKGIGSFFPSI